MMKIVIDISEKTYRRIKREMEIDEEDIPVIALSIFDGTVLPEGHGRLTDIDAGEGLYTEIRNHSNSDIAAEIVEKFPVVLEADKEVEE